MTTSTHKTAPLNHTKYAWFYPLNSNGKEKDCESGFHYYGARYYWSELLTGWLSVDPMMDSFPNITPYLYCSNNPIRLKDPDGNFPIIPIILGAIEVGTAIYDAFDAGQTLFDKNATTVEKLTAIGFFALDVTLPGGGYGVAYKMSSKTVFKIAGTEYRTASDFYKATKKLPIGERLSTYREMANAVATKEGWILDRNLSRKNRDALFT